MFISAIAVVLSTVMASAAPQWHNPQTEQPKGPSPERWSFEGTCVEFTSNSPEITVRYVLDGRSVPKGATESASCGVDLRAIDKDGISRFIEGESSLGSSDGDTLQFVFNVDYGYSARYGDEFSLCLPLYNKVVWMRIGTKSEDDLFAFEPVSKDKPVLFYSMPVEAVSKPSESTVNIIQRKLDLPVRVIPRRGHRKFASLMTVKGKTADTLKTTRAALDALGVPLDLPGILSPVRQRRDIGSYEWTQRHDQVLYRERVTDPNPDVVLIGDSITHYWAGDPYNDWRAGVESWNELFGGLNVINLGYGWDRLGNMMWRLIHGELDGFSAKHIFIMAGTNDIGGRSEAEIAEGVIGLIEYVRFKQPSAKIHLAHIYPRRNAIGKVDKVNALIDEGLESNPIAGLDVVDVKAVLTKNDGTLDESLFRDGLHPNEEGYHRIADVYKNLF